jgi:hypothetical protein
MTTCSEHSHAARVELTEAFVKDRMAGNDSSHDWFHIERVRNLTAALASAEQLTVGGLPAVLPAAGTHGIKHCLPWRPVVGGGGASG